MQLEKIVNYHKALADPTRIRILILLASGERSGQELADKLGVSPATVTHHAAKLRGASLVRERRDKNTIFLSLNDEFVRGHAHATVNLIYRSAEGGDDPMEERHSRLKEAVLKNFFTSAGRLKSIPAQLKKKLIVLEYLVSKLEMGRKYAEREINAFIQDYHDDFATLRREFIMHQYMFRDNEVYELNPRELWARWEKLT